MSRKSAHNINSNYVLTYFDKIVNDIICSIAIRWQDQKDRELVVHTLEELIEMDLVANNKVSQYQVICDSRNNDQEDTERGVWTITIKLKETHCLNTSVINYEFTQTPQDFFQYYF